MKILQIDYNLGVGGAERFVTDLCNSLSMQNEVVMCTILDDTNPENTFHKQFLSPKVKYINLGCKKGLCWKSIQGVLNVINHEKPDVVHGHLVTPLLFIPSLLYRKIKFVTTLHNVAERCLSFSFQKYIDKILFKKHWIIPVTISDICYKSYVKLYGLNNAYMVNNGRTLPVKTKQFGDVKREVESYKRHEDDLVFIHVARFDPQKHQDVLVNVFNKLHDRHLILLILGERYDTLGQYLRDRAKNHIHFLGAKTNVADYLFCSDFFCLTSLWEGLPISLLEAIACCVVPICTPVGGIPNVIKNGITGYLSKDCGEASYEKTVVKAILENGQIDKEILFKEYKKNFSMEECSSKYYKIYLNG